MDAQMVENQLKATQHKKGLNAELTANIFAKSFM